MFTIGSQQENANRMPKAMVDGQHGKGSERAGLKLYGIRQEPQDETELRLEELIGDKTEKGGRTSLAEASSLKHESLKHPWLDGPLG